MLQDLHNKQMALAELLEHSGILSSQANKNETDVNVHRGTFISSIYCLKQPSLKAVHDKFERMFKAMNLCIDPKAAITNESTPCPSQIG